MSIIPNTTAVKFSTLRNASTHFADECYLNNLSATTRSRCQAAYSSVRLLSVDYTSAIVKVRRSSDSAQQDFYYDVVTNNLYTESHGSGSTLETWLGGSTGFVTTLYDQSGNGRTLTQATTSAQPTIDKNGVMTFDGAADTFKATTNIALSAAASNYTIVADWMPTAEKIACVCDFHTTPKTNNTRASIRVNSASYGFCGEANDTGDIANATQNVRRRTVMICDHTLPAKHISLYDNGILYPGTTSSPSTLSLQPTQFAIGANIFGAEFFQGTINEVLVFSTRLHHYEALKYTSDGSTECIPYPVPDIYLDFHPHCIASAGMTNNHDTYLSVRMDNTNFTDTTKFTSASGTTTPTDAGANTGYNTNERAIRFASASSQYLTAGSRSMPIDTNGGFTMIALVKFASTGNFQRIIDFGNGSSSENIVVSRTATNSTLYCAVYTGAAYGSAYTEIMDVGSIVNGEWTVVALRYNASNRALAMYQNGKLIGSATAANPVADRTVANTYIGKSHWGADAYFDGDMMEVAFYVRYLSDVELSAATARLMYARQALSSPVYLTSYPLIKYSGYTVCLPVSSTNGIVRSYAAAFGNDVYNYMKLPTIPTFPITISFLFYIKGTTACTICGLSDTWRPGLGMKLEWSPTNSTLSTSVAMPTTWLTTTTTGVTTGVWHHFAIVLSASFTATVYVDGTANTLTGTDLMPYRSVMYLGASSDTAGGFEGYITDFRIYGRVLGSYEINNCRWPIYKSPRQVATQNSSIVNATNWTTAMVLSTTGSFVSASYHAGDRWQMQLTQAATLNASNTYTHAARIQDYRTFELSFEVYVPSGSTGGALFFYFGAANATVDAPTDTTSQSWYGVDFNIEEKKVKQVTADAGITFPDPDYNLDSIATSEWHAVRITYVQGTNGHTVRVSLRGREILKYSITAANWRTARAGGYWGIGGRNGATLGASIYLRRVQLTGYDTSYAMSSLRSLGYTSSTSVSASAVRNIKPAFLPGLIWKTFDGYAGTDVNYHVNKTYTRIGRTTSTANIAACTYGTYGNNDTLTTALQEAFSFSLTGYFRANVTGTWTFSMSADDVAYAWIGATAAAGWTTANTLVSCTNSVTESTGTVTLTAGQYYAIRVQFGENTMNETFTFGFTPPSGSKTYDGTGYYFAPVGNSISFPAENAKEIKDITGVNEDGVYYINCNGTSTATYCLMNDVYDGGGWMLLLKAAQGTTFPYASTYWTAANTLNPAATDRTNGDAKFDAYNYVQINDVLAIFPDVEYTTNKAFDAVRLNTSADWFAVFINLDPLNWGACPDGRAFYRWLEDTCYNGLVKVEYNSTTTVVQIHGLQSFVGNGASSGGNGNYDTIRCYAKTVAGTKVTTNTLSGVSGSDITVKITPLARFSGSLNINDGWTWEVANWNGASKTTALAGFTSSRDASPFHPLRFAGCDGTVFSRQYGAARHVFGGGTHLAGNHNARWGFLWNNEGDFTSMDAYAGFGLPTWSVGDYYNTATSAGLAGVNRQMRGELYGR